MKLREEYTCPLELVQDMLKGKWKFIILWRLHHGRSSLIQLEKTIEGISQKMLLEQLKELIDFGFVEKKNFEGYPLKVEYRLTEDKGARIIDALTIMQELGVEHLKEKGQDNILEHIRERKLYYDKILGENGE